MEWGPEPSTTNFDVKLGSDRPQTLPKRVSDNPRRFIFGRNVFRNFCKLWRSVYPLRMAPIGLKLGQNAFQTIPNISSFDSETQICFGFLLDHMIIWSYHHMVISSYDHIIIWSYDHMIIWSYDHVIIWSYDHMIIWPYDDIVVWPYQANFAPDTPGHLLQKTGTSWKPLRFHRLHFVVDGAPIYYTAFIYYT